MSGGHGGKRIGAGRKPQGTNNTIKGTKVSRIADEITAKLGDQFEDWINEISPLGVMMLAYRVALQEQDYKTACERAALSAPYVHAKLTSVDSKVVVENKVADLSDEKLNEIIAAIDADKMECPPTSRLN